MIDAGKRQPKDSLAKRYDAEASLLEARSRLPLKKVMEQHGHAPEGGRWKSFKCPFCHKKSKASVYESDGQEWFHCFSDSCPSRGNAKAFDAVGFLAYVANLSRQEAFIVYLKDAGVWKDRATFKSAKPALAAAVAAEPPISGGMASGEMPGHGVEELPHATPPASGDILAESPDENFPTAVTPEEPEEFPATDATSPTSGPSPDITNNRGPSDPARPHAPPNPASTDDPPIAAEPDGAAGNKAAEDRAEAAPPAPAATGLDVIRAFYARLTLLDSDEEELWVKRGLCSATIAALGFRSNPKSNKAELEALAGSEAYDRDVLLESGLWKRKGAQIGVAGQYYGAGRIRQLKPDERPGQGQWKDEDDWLWGWTHPVLIPYVDMDGRLISLRPHKGMAHSGTVAGCPHPYVPRPVRTAEEGDRGRAWEFFRTVVITEGEFKAAALWQIVGAGREDGRQPLGVVALPGISFSRHYETRERLVEFLRKTKADRVVVVFDNEDKGNPELPGYKPDWQKRHDAEIHARYLATYLHTELRLYSRVGTIPSEWRDEKGKADWDGMMARLKDVV